MSLYPLFTTKKDGKTCRLCHLYTHPRPPPHPFYVELYLRTSPLGMTLLGERRVEGGVKGPFIIHDIFEDHFYWIKFYIVFKVNCLDSFPYFCGNRQLNRTKRCLRQLKSRNNSYPGPFVRPRNQVPSYYKSMTETGSLTTVSTPVVTGFSECVWISKSVNLCSSSLYDHLLTRTLEDTDWKETSLKSLTIFLSFSRRYKRGSIKNDYSRS